MTQIKTILARSALALAAGLLISGIISEISFRLLRNTSSRAPTVIELTIPPGTAARVAEGESVLPKDMSLVAGDTLVVNNQDSVAHMLGPMYIPAGASGRLPLDVPDNLVYACSFQPEQYQGLDVGEPLTFYTRLRGVLLAGAPLGMLFGLYSLVIWPLKPRAKAKPAA
jgi:hypothetical protein